MKKEMDLMEGQEVWTNAFGNRFGERVCVGIQGGRMVHGGEWFTPTKVEIKEVWGDMLRSEGIRV